MKTVVQYSTMRAEALTDADDDLILIDLKTRAQSASRTRQQGVAKPIMEHVNDNRVLAPVSLLAALALLFILSPFLPLGIREYISALIR